jgi:guanylate cyclase soluble subunit alpha
MSLIQDIDVTDYSHGDMDHSVFEIKKESEFFSVKKHGESTVPHDLSISVPTLCCAFPFHIIFDMHMEIQQLGAALLRLIGHSLVQYGTSMSTYFELIRPDIKFTFESILCRINGSFFLLLKSAAQSETVKDKLLMELKGQMINLPESNCILFLASPLVKKLEQLKGRGLFLSDIPIHDATRDLILVSEQAQAQDGLKKRMEQLQTELKEASNELEEEKKKTVDLLSSIFPQDVATKLIDKQPVPARFIENVTMLFSDIVGFTSICGKCTAMDVVEMLIDLYTKFDKLCGELDLYKVRMNNHAAQPITFHVLNDGKSIRIGLNVVVLIFVSFLDFPG